MFRAHICISRVDDDEKAMFHLPPLGMNRAEPWPFEFDHDVPQQESEAAAREHEIKVNYTFRVRWSSMSAGANDSTDPLAPSICYFATAGAVGSDPLTRNLSSTFITHLHFSP